MSEGVMAAYGDLPDDVQKHLLELETFIGDCDGQWTALQTSEQDVVLDNGTIDASDAVAAFNGIVAALRASPPASPAGGERETPYFRAWLEVIEQCNKLKEENYALRNAVTAAPAQSNGDRVYAVGGDGTFDESDETPEERSQSNGDAGISDAMVQRACEIYSQVYADDDKDMGDAMRAVLKDVLS